MLDRGFHSSLGTDTPNQGHQVANMLNVIEGEADLHAGLGAASLERGASREDTHNLHAEVGEDGADGAAKSASVGHQEYNCGDAPRHAQHGESSAPAVEAHGLECLS